MWTRRQCLAAAVTAGLGAGAGNLLGKTQMDLRVTHESSGVLRAVLFNRSDGPKAILHSSDIQPSKVILTGTDGKTVEPFDERTRMKFDRTVRRAMFVRIQAGAEMELETGRFRQLADGKFELHWGPYHYRQIPAGDWKVQVMFESSVQGPSDKSTVEDIWVGKVSSNVLSVRLS